MSEQDTKDIKSYKDFIQLNTGPFELDIIYAPDGIENYEKAKDRAIQHDIFPIASIEDIIASKKAANRPKDKRDIPLIEDFRKAWKATHPTPLKSSLDIHSPKRRYTKIPKPPGEMPI